MAKITLQTIIDKYRETFYIEDPSPIAIIASAILTYRLKTPPIWLYLIGPSSGGKSQFIEIFSKVDFVTQVSDLTINTFLSGKIDTTQETSLLRRLGPEFVVTMKDFTTILSKSEETQQNIIAQMREIYDGHFTKHTGHGKVVEWGGDGKNGHPKGKGTFIMAATEAIFNAQDKFSEMGTRAINYVLVPQDRKRTCRQAMKFQSTRAEKVTELQDLVYEFIMAKINVMPKILPPLDEALEEEIIEITDFSTICRSVVKRDFRGAKTLALSAEMPMRMSGELQGLIQGFIYMNDGELPEYLKAAAFKVALDSIPKQRRLILGVLAQYNKANKAAIADLINYSPERTGEWLEDLNMFDVVERVKKGNAQFWRLKEEYRAIMRKYLGIINTEKDLEAEEDGSAMEYSYGNFQDIPVEDSYELKEQKENAQQQANLDWEKLGK